MRTVGEGRRLSRPRRDGPPAGAPQGCSPTTTLRREIHAASWHGRLARDGPRPGWPYHERTLRREIHAAQEVLEARVGAQGVEPEI